MALDLDDVDFVGTLGPLLGEEAVELGNVHGLDKVADAAQLGDLQIDESVEVAVLPERLDA